MLIDIKIPTPGESITEVELAKWFVEEGEIVEKDQEIAEIESDKATLTLVAEESGKISLLIEEGTTVNLGETACRIDTSFENEKKNTPEIESEIKQETNDLQPKEDDIELPTDGKKEEYPNVKVTHVAQKMMQDNHLSIDDVIAGLQRVGKREINKVLESEEIAQEPSSIRPVNSELKTEKREKMSMLRRKLSERLVSVKNETAMLTTFNEIDMSSIKAIRQKHQARFLEKHGIKLGFMAFFAKAVSIALQRFPLVNSWIDNEEIVTPNYSNIGIAVQTPKGLMVPIVRNVESKSIFEIENQIKILADKARNRKISLDELAGGTFTITNGGVFGSLLSTPILNPPQSGILGMHNIVDRPVAVDNQVMIRPMMYVALSYDHRIVDGKDSVGFLKTVKDLLEHPEHLLSGTDPIEDLLQL